MPCQQPQLYQSISCFSIALPVGRVTKLFSFSPICGIRNGISVLIYITCCKCLIDSFLWICLIHRNSPLEYSLIKGSYFCYFKHPKALEWSWHLTREFSELHFILAIISLTLEDDSWVSIGISHFKFSDFFSAFRVWITV